MLDAYSQLSIAAFSVPAVPTNWNPAIDCAIVSPQDPGYRWTMQIPQASRFAVLLLLLVAAGVLAAEKKPLDSFEVRTNLVLINATVLDRNHRPVRGLARDRFQLFENRVEQPVTYFTEEETPVSLAIVLDVSGSMAGKFTGAIEALKTVLENANHDDEFSLITFSDRSQLAAGWTTDAVEIQNCAALQRPQGRTALLDAIHLALTQLPQARNSRRAILIFSDGGDNYSRYNERQISRILDEADVQMYAIDMSAASLPHNRSVEEIDGPDLLARLCDRAGGRYWQLDGRRELAKTADQIAKEMRSQYILGFAPSLQPEDGRYHSVKLQLTPAPQQSDAERANEDKSRLSVYWRHGYRVPVR